MGCSCADRKQEATSIATTEIMHSRKYDGNNIRPLQGERRKVTNVHSSQKSALFAGGWLVVGRSGRVVLVD
jgi:hypothetical protein